MPVRYCITLPGGRKVCLPITALVPWWKLKFIPFPPPKPDPPPDWLKDFGIADRVLNDIFALASIYEIAEGLNPALKKEFQAFTRTSLEAQKIPAQDVIVFEK